MSLPASGDHHGHVCYVRSIPLDMPGVVELDIVTVSACETMTSLMLDGEFAIPAR